MRYLRMLSNSAVTGLVAAIYVTLLFVLLNPSLPLTFGATLPLLAVIAMSYGVHVGVMAYAGLVARQLISIQGFMPAWVSLRMLAWSSGVSSAVVALLLWVNAFGYRTALGEDMLQALTAGAVTLAIGGGLLLAVALMRTFVQRGRVVVGTIYTVIALGSVGLPLYLRHRVVSDRPVTPAASSASHTVAAANGAPRVVMLLLDGASLDIISPAVAAGRLPNFGRLIEEGASMHLATTRPTQPEPVWSSVVTGKWPLHHGIKGAATYRPFIGGRAVEVLPDLLFTRALVRLGFLVEEPYSPSSLRAAPLWRMLTRQGVSTGIVGVPLTYPSERIDGFMVSDRDLALAALRNGIGSSPLPGRLELLPQTGEDGAGVPGDQAHHDLAARLAGEQPVRFLAVRYAGLDAVAHYYMRYAMPGAFGDVSEEEQQRFGRVLDDYYGYVDGLVGDALASLHDDDLLLVVSGFGMEPLSPGKRLIERVAGNPQFSGTHERAPDGFLLAFGRSVSRGRLARGAVVDVTPTLLYFLDQPVGRDMDGFARTDLFNDAFNAQRTITFIPTYDR